MLKRTLLGAVAAVALLAGGTAANAVNQPFADGWNHVQAQNCVFIPGNPAAVPPVLDRVDIYLDVLPDIVPAPPPAPPPIIAMGVMHTTDPIAITLVAPYCKDGVAFFFWWDVATQTPLYFSLAKAWE